MLIFRGGNWPEHRPWFLFLVVASVAAALLYAFEGYRSGLWPAGSSGPGFAYGVIGGLIIVFEMLLWLRKKFRVVRIGRAKLWMKAHIWLGLLCLPLLVLHSGFRFWNLALSGILMAVLFIVIASGIWGLALQQVLPTMMLEEVPAETIRSQIDRVLGQLLAEARRLVRATCGQSASVTGAGGQTMGVGGQTMGDIPMGQEDQTFLVIGAVRSAGRVQGKVLQTRTQAMMVLNSEPLLLFFEQHVVPFFDTVKGLRSPLGSSKRATAMFRELKSFLAPEAHAAVDTLEGICDQRRQLAHQARLYAWLHAWLLIHLPLSVALLVLMIAHIFYAMKYF
jgi:hypothetical protein